MSHKSLFSSCFFLKNSHKARAKTPRLSFKKLYISACRQRADFYSKVLGHGAGLTAYAARGAQDTNISHHNYIPFLFGSLV